MNWKEWLALISFAMIFGAAIYVRIKELIDKKKKGGG